ncbi:MAG: conjugal transfer protein TraH [Methyloprofundus sp.]|nr:conjugal transfer protein TraH [Methyloprofundus sp.]
MKKTVIAAAIIASMVSLKSHASVGELFEQMGTVTSTSPGAFKGQTMTHYVGGSASFRTPQRTYQLASMSPPSISAGCGGIDLYAGSFSFINSDQLVRALQNIGNNAAGAIFKLAIDSVSPQLGGVMDYMNDLSQKINALNVNSCQAAEGFVEMGADLVRGNKTDNYVTQWGSRVSGVWDDVSSARENISKNISDRKSARESAKSDPDIGDKLRPVNITWESLRAARYNGGNTIGIDDARLMVTLFGSVICSNQFSPSDTGDADRACLFERPSFDTFSDFLVGDNFEIKASQCLLTGGSDQQRACMSNEYASTLRYEYTVQGNQYHNFQAYIKAEMDFLKDSLISRGFTSGGNLDDARLKRAFGIVNMSRVPAWSLIKLSSMDAVGSSFYSNAADAIAADIAYNYIIFLSEAVRRSVYQERAKGRFTATQDDQAQLDAQLAHIGEVVGWFDGLRLDAQTRFAELGQISATVSALSSSFEHRMAQINRR